MLTKRSSLGLWLKCCFTSTETVGLLGTGRMGGRGYGGGGKGRLYTYRYTVTTRMIPALRWAAMRTISMFHNCERQSHKTVHKPQLLKRKASRSGIEPRSFRLPAYRLTAGPNRPSPRKPPHPQAFICLPRTAYGKTEVATSRPCSTVQRGVLWWWHSGNWVSEAS